MDLRQVLSTSRQREFRPRATPPQFLEARRMKSIEQLNRAERLQRIGELLSKGITLMLLQKAEREQDRDEESSATTPNVKKPSGSEQQNNDRHDPKIEKDILNYLKRVGGASPRDVQQALDLSKATAYRYLIRMVENQSVIRTGRTTSVRYSSVARDPSESGQRE